MKKYFVLIILIFVLLSFVISVFLVRNRLDSISYGEVFTKIDKPFEFVIKPTNDNINIIIIHLKNPGLENTNRFELSIFRNNEKIREFMFSGENIGDPSDLKFQFEPIKNSKGSSLRIELKPLDFNLPISIYTKADGTPFYRVYYRSAKELSVLQKWVLEWKVRIIENRGFFAIWALMLSLVAYWGLKNEEK